MHRLLNSELSHIIRPQSPVKIELLAYVLCEIQVDTLERVDIADIKNILCSCEDSQIDESFHARALDALSTECEVCGNSYPRCQMESMFLCNHSCCINCVKDYYRVAIQNARSPEALNALTCYEKHDLPVDIDTRMNFFQYLGSKVGPIALISSTIFKSMRCLFF